MLFRSLRSCFESIGWARNNAIHTHLNVYPRQIQWVAHERAEKSVSGLSLRSPPATDHLPTSFGASPFYRFFLQVPTLETRVERAHNSASRLRETVAPGVPDTSTLSCFVSATPFYFHSPKHITHILHTCRVCSVYRIHSSNTNDHQHAPFLVNVSHSTLWSIVARLFG